MQQLKHTKNVKSKKKKKDLYKRNEIDMFDRSCV